MSFYRFLASTHYTNYDPWLFAINLTALILVLIPKLPMVSNVLYLSSGYLFHYVLCRPTVSACAS